MVTSFSGSTRVRTADPHAVQRDAQNQLSYKLV